MKILLKEKLEYQKYIHLRDSNQKKVNTIATYRMMFFLIMLFSFILKYYYYPELFQIIFMISLIIFILVLGILSLFLIYNMVKRKRMLVSHSILWNILIISMNLI